jgi:hypothetical protein
LGRDTIEPEKSSEILQYLIQVQPDTFHLNLSSRECVVFLLLLKRTGTLGGYPDIVTSLAEKIANSNDAESICRCLGFLSKPFPTLCDHLKANLSQSDYGTISAEAIVHLLSSNPAPGHIPALAERWLKLVSISTHPKIIIPGTVSFTRYAETQDSVFDFFWKFMKSRQPLSHPDRLGAAEIFRRRKFPAEVAQVFAESPDLAKTPNPEEFYRILTAVSSDLEISTLEGIIGKHFKLFGNRYTGDHVEIASDLLRKPRKTKCEIL